ncbi:MAG: hypothetical protein E7561_00975 [Ruminococcaceae bacterium]|nr:hypothetical protein [Oscillospiraceae bacterium]
MYKIFKSVISVMMCAVLFVTAYSFDFTVSADIQGDIAKLQQQSKEIQAEINDLKKQKASQQSVLNAIEKKIANTQAQIRACNNQISSINAKINENKAEIDKNNAEIASTKEEFKKRIRAIYMSNSDSSVKILLGAENFADYLQLAQMTATVSKHDKAIIEKIADAVKALEEKNKENEKLIENQVSIRATVEEALKGLEGEEAEAEKLYNSINKDQKAAESDKAYIEKLIKEKEAALFSSAGTGNIQSFINPKSGFMWPVPGYFNIYSGWGNRSGGMHYGIDISQGGIYGKPIVAITDGTVYNAYSGCPHRDKKSRCRCGSGWGNYVRLYHGVIKGNDYYAMYAHMDTVASGIYVGKSVKQGDVIGYVGTTGDSTGYHLHFGISINGTGRGNWVNPTGYFF